MSDGCTWVRSPQTTAHRTTAASIVSQKRGISSHVAFCLPTDQTYNTHERSTYLLDEGGKQNVKISYTFRERVICSTKKSDTNYFSSRYVHISIYSIYGPKWIWRADILIAWVVTTMIVEKCIEMKFHIYTQLSFHHNRQKTKSKRLVKRKRNK